MASNREERRLMRQRGAANRKVKEVDFGFSFGTPKSEAPQKPPQRPPSSQSLSRKDATPISRPSIPSAPRTRRTPVRDGAHESHTKTPGSSRSVASEKPSIYDIPPDDGPEQRSAKRRKLSVSLDSHGIELSQSSARVETAVQPVSQVLQESATNGTTNTTISPTPLNSEEPSHLQKVSRPENPPKNDEDQIVLPSSTLDYLGDGAEANEEHADEDDGHGAAASPNPDATPRHKRKKRKSVVVKQTTSRKNAAKFTEGHQEESTPKGVGDANVEQSNKTSEKPVSSPRSPRHPRRREIPKKRTTLLRSGKVERTGDVDHNQRLQQNVNGADPRGEAHLVHSQPETLDEDDEVVQTEGETHEVTSNREAPEGELVLQEEPDSGERATQKAISNQRRSEQAIRTAAQRNGPGQREQVSEEVQNEVVPDQPESEEQPRPTISKGRKNRKSLKEGQQTREGSSKRRKSRGEAVPVVVHRLENVGELDVDLEHESFEGSHPPDEPSSSYKFPTHSGVNAADVLSQICRETLEKTMSTLDNSISQESNPARRAEWIRKRKAVEAFSTELGHRLFDISEIMESNYVLAAQLRKEKKEMVALRNELMEVRRERREIALKIDDVRRRYAEEEEANKEQDTLNDALHNLQLALDRSQTAKGNGVEPNPFVGLEFLLRTVAQDVSSVAPDSYGGLLNQVRNFNSELERILKEK
ncbi:hypothetical protein VTO42DRAFT_5735 [Malbranchea cinnamomea]